MAAQNREAVLQVLVNQQFMDKIDHGDWFRADGRTLCRCGKEYRQHPEWEAGPTFRMLCDGAVVKL